MEQDGAIGIITEWLSPSGYCGRTAYGPRVRTNREWCRREAARLAARGISASIETNADGLIAVSRQ